MDDQGQASAMRDANNIMSDSNDFSGIFGQNFMHTLEKLALNNLKTQCLIVKERALYAQGGTTGEHCSRKLILLTQLMYERCGHVM